MTPRVFIARKYWDPIEDLQLRDLLANARRGQITEFAKRTGRTEHSVKARLSYLRNLDNKQAETLERSRRPTGPRFARPAFFNENLGLMLKNLPLALVIWLLLDPSTYQVTMVTSDPKVEAAAIAAKVPVLTFDNTKTITANIVGPGNTGTGPGMPTLLTVSTALTQ